MKLKSFLPAVLVLSFILSSCNRSGQEIYKVVPDNAGLVASFSPGKLLEKADAKNFGYIKETLGDKEFNTILFENPGISGIDVNANSCVFLTGKEEKYLGVVMPVKSKKVFEIFLDKMVEEYKVDFKIEEGNNFRFSKEGNNILAWNKNILIHLTRLNGSEGSPIEEKVAALFSLEDENCILSDKDFKSFISEQKDLNIWLTSNQIGSLTGSNGIMGMLGSINNNYAHLSLEFQKGAVEISSNLKLNSDFKKNLDKFNFIDLNAGKDILKMLPADNLILAGNFRLNPEKMMDIIRFFGSGNSSFMQDFEKETGKTTEEVLKSVQGSIAFTINGIMPVNQKPDEAGEGTVNEKNIPVIMVCLQLNNEEYFKEFIRLIKQKETLSEKDGYFVIQAEEVPFFMGVKNNVILLTNEEKYMTEILANGTIRNNLLSLDISNSLINNPICFYLNLDRDSYSENMKDYFNREMDKGFAKGMKGFGSSLKSLTLSGNIEKSELRIELKDKEVNSLHAFLQALDH